MNLNSVQRMLSNRRYMGEYTFRDIVVPDGIPAIVPKELFDRVQEKMAKNKKAPARHKAEDDYLLTTKLFCGYCGAYLCGESGTSPVSYTHLDVYKRQRLAIYISVLLILIRQSTKNKSIKNSRTKKLYSNELIPNIVPFLIRTLSRVNATIEYFSEFSDNIMSKKRSCKIKKPAIILPICFFSSKLKKN